MKLFWPSTGGAVLALVFFFGIPKRRRNWLAMLSLLVLFVSGVVIGCGGGGVSGGGGSNPSNPGTSAGTYTVTMTGTRRPSLQPPPSPSPSTKAVTPVPHPFRFFCGKGGTTIDRPTSPYSIPYSRNYTS